MAIVYYALGCSHNDSFSTKVAKMLGCSKREMIFVGGGGGFGGIWGIIASGACSGDSGDYG